MNPSHFQKSNIKLHLSHSIKSGESYSTLKKMRVETGTAFSHGTVTVNLIAPKSKTLEKEEFANFNTRCGWWWPPLFAIFHFYITTYSYCFLGCGAMKHLYNDKLTLKPILQRVAWSGVYAKHSQPKPSHCCTYLVYVEWKCSIWTISSFRRVTVNLCFQVQIHAHWN